VFPRWIVSVAGRSYGPFSVEQMRSFVAEGRLVPHSLAVREGDAAVGPASNDPLLAPMFDQQPRPPLPQTPSGSARPSNAAAKQIVDSEHSHYVIAADMKSGSVASLETAILNLGPAVLVAPQVWVVSTGKSISAIRSLLIHEVGKMDRLLVVDATHDKIAWFNYSPEAEARLRQLWAKPSSSDHPLT